MLIYFRKRSFRHWTIVSSYGKWCQLFSTILIHVKISFGIRTANISWPFFYIWEINVAKKIHLFINFNKNAGNSHRTQLVCQGWKMFVRKSRPENALILKYRQYFRRRWKFSSSHSVSGSYMDIDCDGFTQNHPLYEKNWNQRNKWRFIWINW